MDEKRVALNMKVRPAIRQAVDAFAKREKRSANNVAEILLEWAVGQLERSGSTLALMQSGDQAGSSVAIDRAVLEGAKPKRKRR